MKLINFPTFFSKKSKSNLKKKTPSESSSVRSSATASSFDDKITKRELDMVFRQLTSDPPTDDELTSMIGDGDGCINLDQLLAIGSKTLGPLIGNNEIQDAFAVFDADGDGKISAEELLSIFLAMEDGGCSIDDCRRMIAGVDSDGDGYVGFEDFVRMMDGQR